MFRQFPSRIRTIGLALALVPAIVGLGACKSNAERADELAQQAQTQMEVGDFVAARQSVGEAIALRDDQGRYHELRGAIALRLDDPVDAYRSFSRALEFDAANRLALAYVASLGVQLGLVAEADEAADRLLALQPGALPAMQVKGMLALSRNRYVEATDYADRILATRPTDEAGSVIKARALVKTGEPEAGLQWIEGALRVKPDSVGLLANKLNIYRYLKQPQEMASVIDQIVRLAGSTPAYRLDQINLLYRLGRPDEARQATIALLKMGSVNPNDYRALQSLWWQYDKTPLPDAAAATSGTWEDPRSIVMIVRYLLRRGDLRTADIILRNAPEKYETMLDSLRVRLLAASGQGAQARQQVDAILKAEPQDVDALLQRAQFALADRNLDLALESAQAALTNDPLNAEAYVMLANVYRATGSEARARQVFEDGMKSQPQSAYMAEQYARYLMQQGEKTRAISLGKSFARSLPSLPKAAEFYGAQCRWTGNDNCLRDAAAAYQAARTAYLVDDPPGKAPNLGLLGRL